MAPSLSTNLNHDITMTTANITSVSDMMATNATSIVNAGIMTTNATSIVNITSVAIASIFVSLLVGAFIFTGNTMTVVAVYHTPALRTVPNRYVVSLAVADLLAGVMMLYQTVKYFPGMERQFDLSKTMCLTRHALLVTSISASVASMVLISIDRLVYIRLPLQYDRLVTPRRAGICICVTWVLSLLVGTVSLYYNNWDTASHCTMFQVFTVHHQVYILGSLFAICCLIIASCYCHIIRIAYRHRRAISQTTQLTSKSDVEFRLRHGWPLARMFIIVYGTFLLCWLPCMVGLVLGYTVGISVDVMNFLIPLGATNCGMNFAIYALTNTDFRSAFRKMVCTCRTQNPEVV